MNSEWARAAKRMITKGDTVHVRSTRKDANFDGEVIATGNVTLTVANGDRSRTYPWGQIAYVEKSALAPSGDDSLESRIALAVLDDQSDSRLISVEERKRRLERLSAVIALALRGEG